ncbi:uncharacterized protein [Glycine max]|uniref:uncharacterized protein n=1 Tax=Glycine max TaxID=3847 RepID=UPI001B3575C1|nr:uncharacterized protein LOC121174575 [Glycine max]
MKKKKVATVGISLSETYALSEQHPLSEALSELSELGESRRESVKHAPAQRAINAPNYHSTVSFNSDTYLDSSECRSQRPRETSLPQDTQLRIPRPKESFFLVRRREEIGASLRDASLLCVAVGFVKNAAELQFKIRELYRHINNDCYCFFLRLLAFDFSGFHQAYVVSLLPIPVIALL